MRATVFLLAAILLFPLAAQATTVTQDSTGDHTSIQAAIDAASSGDTIELGAGVFAECLVINKSINLIGAGPSLTVLQGNLSCNVIEVTANDCTISGFSITDGGYGTGIILQGDNNTVTNCWVVGSMYGIALGNCSRNTISGCEVNFNAAGIYMGNTHSNNVSNCSMNYNYAHGISLYFGFNNTFTDCELNYNDYGAHMYWISNANTLSRCTANNNSFGFYIMDSHFTTLTDCMAEGNSDSGFHISSVDVTVTRCSASNNLVDGFNLYHSDHATITENVVDGNGRDGFNLRYSTNNIISNNAIIENLGEGISVDKASMENTIHHNSLIANSLNANDDGESNLYNINSGGNYWSDYKVRYPGAITDGITWSTPYVIDGTSMADDELPLVNHTLKEWQLDLIGEHRLNDLDDDGVIDQEDELPTDPKEWNDEDDDGYGDNSDAFPTDPAASMDTDGDGYPDQWNHGYGLDDSNLTIDDYPNDDTRWEKSSPNNEVPWIWLLLIGLLLAIITIVFVAMILGRKDSPF